MGGVMIFSEGAQGWGGQPVGRLYRGGMEWMWNNVLGMGGFFVILRGGSFQRVTASIRPRPIYHNNVR